jgi:uncharacterized protein YecT (DUF1311 family)
MRSTVHPVLRIAAITFAAFTSPVLAYFDEEYDAQKQKAQSICAEVEKIPIPGADRPTSREAAALKGCDPVALYYGVDTKPNPIKARHCAFLAMDANEMGYEYHVLSMLYANGRGVSRNIDLALRFACGIDGAPAESTYRVNGLAEFRNKDPDSTTFEVCDYVTSSQSMGWCTDLAERRQNAARDLRLNSLKKDWTPAAQRAYRKLEMAFDSFVDQRTDHEIMCNCQNYLVYAHGEESILRNRFVAEIAQFEAKRWFPSYTVRDFKEGDAELNTVYREIMALPKIEWESEYFGGHLKKDGIRKAQKAWLKYRDAWVTFGTTNYPQVHPDAWKTWTTRKRTKMLKDLLVQMHDDIASKRFSDSLDAIEKGQ